MLWMNYNLSDNGRKAHGVRPMPTPPQGPAVTTTRPPAAQSAQTRPLPARPEVPSASRDLMSNPEVLELAKRYGIDPNSAQGKYASDMLSLAKERGQETTAGVPSDEDTQTLNWQNLLVQLGNIGGQHFNNRYAGQAPQAANPYGRQLERAMVQRAKAGSQRNDAYDSARAAVLKMFSDTAGGRERRASNLSEYRSLMGGGDTSASAHPSGGQATNLNNPGQTRSASASTGVVTPEQIRDDKDAQTVISALPSRVRAMAEKMAMDEGPMAAAKWALKQYQSEREFQADEAHRAGEVDREAAKTRAREAAKLDAKQQAAEIDKDKGRLATQTAFDRLAELPTEYGSKQASGAWNIAGTSAFDRAVGAIDGGDDWITAPIRALRSLQSGLTDPTGRGRSDVHQSIDVAVGILTNTMKGFVRKPGEGTWSEGDQANLERMLGELKTSDNTDGYNRRVAEVRELISKAFELDLKDPITQRAANYTTSELMAAGVRAIQSGKDPEAVIEIVRKGRGEKAAEQFRAMLNSQSSGAGGGDGR